MSDPKILVAVDVDNMPDAITLAKQLSPELCRLKIGKELFTHAGPGVVEAVMALGYEVFLDLKFHDIPNTVAKAVKASAELGVWMVNVHASGGERMLVAAKEALVNFNQPPLLIAVTVLTSMSAEDLAGVGITVSPEQQVLHLASLTARAGLDGVVCSAIEAPKLRKQYGQDFCLVTPGIRPLGSTADDQRRIVTPEMALAAGSSFLVIGRPITAAENPLAALETISQSLSG